MSVRVDGCVFLHGEGVGGRVYLCVCFKVCLPSYLEGVWRACVCLEIIYCRERGQGCVCVCVCLEL